MQAEDVTQTWADVSSIKKLGYRNSMKIQEGVILRK